jgi:hypothetical protein
MANVVLSLFLILKIAIEQGSENLIYLDESGFEANTYRPYAWSTAWFYMVGNPTVAQAQNVVRNPMEKEGVREELVPA